MVACLSDQSFPTVHIWIIGKNRGREKQRERERGGRRDNLGYPSK